MTNNETVLIYLTASRVGVKFGHTEKKWVYQPDGEDVRECVSIKEAALGLLSFK